MEKIDYINFFGCIDRILLLMDTPHVELLTF